MLVLAGPPAHPSFHLKRLAEAVRRRAPGVEALDARFVFFVALRPGAALEADERALLGEILDERPAVGPADPGSADLLVAPRPGTISAWSSRATDIVRGCGLGKVARVERGTAWRVAGRWSPGERAAAAGLLHDRMVEAVLPGVEAAGALFRVEPPRPLRRVPLGEDPASALRRADAELGLALAEPEIAYLVDLYRRLGRDPTDAELVMFAQANSEHCRHKIFNARWVVDGEAQPLSPFAMIRHTHAVHPGRTLSAYRDNAAVVEGHPVARFEIDPADRVYRARPGVAHLLMKVETHNHPTGIAPWPGAATGSGGEIRDEGATGRGGKPRAGLCAYCVSDLHLPGAPRPWELDAGRSPRMADPLRIMIEAPLGAAAYNNEFGRPNLAGAFRTFTVRDAGGLRGYHKPIMLAGGMGHVRPEHVAKAPVPVGAALVVLGGPAMRIGLGGGAASSRATGAGAEELDFASVQRADPEVERRCQEVIDRCAAMGEANPILSIHDVGAGGLSNALPELVHDAGRGAVIDLGRVPTAEPGMSPMETWCNEAQERYVLAIRPEDLPRFAAICERERAPWAAVGEATGDGRLRVTLAGAPAPPVDLDLAGVLGGPPRMERRARRPRAVLRPLDTGGIEPAEALDRLLTLPAVASKGFLITIGDRSVTGTVARDQMVGPWQVPVADVAVTVTDHAGRAGEAMALGERPPVALLDAPASGRLAVAEALLNLLAADVPELGRVVLSANWMAAAGDPEEDARLYDTVRALGLELCPALGVSIPVGKDSLSMRARWRDAAGEHEVRAPLTVVVSAFAPVRDAGRTLTPQLVRDPDTTLILVDLSGGAGRLGGSALAQVMGRSGGRPADLDRPERLVGLWRAMDRVRDRVLAWHDVSDGGVAVTLCEMAFAGHVGLRAELPGEDPVRALFAEEPGGVMQVRAADAQAVLAALAAEGVPARAVGAPTGDDHVELRAGGRVALRADRVALHRRWAETSYRIAALRDDPDCAREEWDNLLDRDDPGLSTAATFEVGAAPAARTARPRVAILREQGINGHLEMAAAFDRAGFEVVDVHMSDLLGGTDDLSGYRGLVAPGGFSFGDVLGAGRGQALRLLHHPRAAAVLRAFFERPDTFALGVCNGCQLLAHLAPLIPGAEGWPRFEANRSRRFEARWCRLEILDSPSVLLAGMAGSLLPVPVAHGEGRAAGGEGALVAARYVDNRGRPTERYPFNPNGSPGGATAFTTADGRVTIMMPHPERAFRGLAWSWAPGEAGEETPWMRLFHNARAWVEAAG